ncbi:MAG TPA: CoA pyrophosphatase, partial [Gemmatimonadales bacterium]
LPRLFESRARAAHVAAGATHLGSKAARLQSARPAARGRVLRGWLRIAFALNPRRARLRERLAGRLHRTDDDPGLIWAAVALVLTPDPDSILLIRRAERPGDPWSGHMALPGGRQESGDADLVATAIREIREEVGVGLSRTDLAGRLEDVVPRTPVLPPIAVRPFVFLPPTRPTLVLNHEVAAHRWVTLEDLMSPGAHHPVRLEVGGQSREVDAYEVEDAIVWGMTERILTDLLEQLRD